MPLLGCKIYTIEIKVKNSVSILILDNEYFKAS